MAFVRSEGGRASGDVSYRASDPPGRRRFATAPASASSVQPPQRNAIIRTPTRRAASTSYGVSPTSVRISLGSDAHGPRELLNFMAADDLVAWAAAVRERHFR